MPDSGTRFTGASHHWISKLPAVKEEEDDSTSSSSIANDSDLSDGDCDVDSDGNCEVESKPLNGLAKLENVLPIKRGISTFYAGKSKSYGSLADAVSLLSIQDFVKQEDAFSRKRKNMLAHTVLLDNLRKSSSESGVSKRLARCVEIGERSNLNASMTGACLPPLPRNGRRVMNNESSDSSPRLYSSPWRPLSLSDLQHASSYTGLVSTKARRDERI